MKDAAGLRLSAIFNIMIDINELSIWASLETGNELAVPNIRQETDYTCGPSALQAVLTYFGHDINETELVRECGTTPLEGTPISTMIEVLRNHGMTVITRSDLTPEKIADILQSGSLVIIALQAWSEDNPPANGYSERWDSGHYVIPIEVTKDAILFADSAIGGRRSYLTIPEFMSRWHSEDFQHMYQEGFGIIISGYGPIRFQKNELLPPPIEMG